MPKKLYIFILDWELPFKHLIRLELTPDNPLYYTRYGYAALLGITLFGGLLLNGLSQTQYLLSKVQCRNLPPWLSRLSQSADPSPPRCDCVTCSKVGLTKSFSIKYILYSIAQGPTGLSVCSAGVLGLAPGWSHIMAWWGNVVSGMC